MRTLNPLLSTTHLTIGYKTHILFHELNLSLYAGKLVCFMGPNGIGKSSLIRTLAGLQKSFGGKVQIHEDVRQSVAQQISVVLTDKISAGNMTVRELITFGRYPYLHWDVRLSQRDRSLIDDAINQVRINHLVNQKLFQLSDGQLQMAMIARALAQDTPIILLDEPTAHLDLNNRVEVMNLLRRLSREMDKATLIATHELDLALQTADVIWLTGKEKNILTGIPEDLVLDGSFDDVFQFKGYDLKTGKLQHEAHKGIIVELEGEGAAFLWTKNALERSGFQVITDRLTVSGSTNISVYVEVEETKPQWRLIKNNQQYQLDTIAKLIELI